MFKIVPFVYFTGKKDSSKTFRRGGAAEKRTDVTDIIRSTIPTEQIAGLDGGLKSCIGGKYQNKTKFIVSIVKSLLIY